MKLHIASSYSAGKIFFVVLGAGIKDTWIFTELEWKKEESNFHDSQYSCFKVKFKSELEASAAAIANAAYFYVYKEDPVDGEEKLRMNEAEKALEAIETCEKVIAKKNREAAGATDPIGIAYFLATHFNLQPIKVRQVEDGLEYWYPHFEINSDIFKAIKEFAPTVQIGSINPDLNTEYSLITVRD